MGKLVSLRAARISFWGSMGTLLLGIVHIGATKIVYDESFSSLPEEAGRTFLYMFMMTGLALVFAGGLGAYAAKKLKQGDLSARIIILAVGIFVAVAGVGAVYAMPDNLFAYIVLVVAAMAGIPVLWR